MTKAILDWLNSLTGCKALKRHMNEYTEAGSPDIEGCILGCHFEIEVKKEGGSTEAGRKRLQEIRADQWEKAGAIVLRNVMSLQQVKDAFVVRFPHLGLADTSSPPRTNTSAAPCAPANGKLRRIK